MVNGLQIPLNTLLCSPLFFYRNRDQQSGKQQVKQQRWILTGLSQCLKRNQKDEAEECCRSEVWINILHVRLCLRQSRLICLSSVPICLRLWLHWTFTHHKTWCCKNTSALIDSHDKMSNFTAAITTFIPWSLWLTIPFMTTGQCWFFFNNPTVSIACKLEVRVSWRVAFDRRMSFRLLFHIRALPWFISVTQLDLLPVFAICNLEYLI